MKFIVVSRLEKTKNIDIVIDVFNELKEDELWIVGTGRYENELKQKAKGSNIKFFGYVDEKTLKKLFKDADVCIMPHVNEPFGLVPYEIAKYGKPSIISELSGVADLAKKYRIGLIFNPHDRKDLVDKINRIKNKNLYEELSKRAKILTKLINSKTEFEKFLEIIPKNAKKILIVHSQFIEIGGAEKSILGLYEKLSNVYNCNLYYRFDRNTNRWKVIYKSKIKKILLSLDVLTSFKRLLYKVALSDIIIISLTGNILTIPTYWVSLILGRIMNKKIIIYIYEPPVNSQNLILVEKISLSPLIIFDILLTKCLIENSRNILLFSISDLSKRYFIKRYKINKEIDIIYPLFHLSL